MFDAGHSHLPTDGGRLVPGCPLCEHVKETRNRAIDHLSEALHLLAGLRRDEDPVTVRLNLSPIGLTGDDVHRCHSIDLSAKQAEALADAVDSMHAYAASQPTAQVTPAADREAIPSGEWSAAAVAQNDRQLFADVTDLFTSLDPVSLLDDVVNSPNPGRSAEAYEDLVTGERGEQL